MQSDESSPVQSDLETGQPPEEIFGEDAIRAAAVSVRMAESAGRRTLPLRTQGGLRGPNSIEQQPHVEVLDLTSGADWDELNNLIRAKASPQIAPWMRCLSLLRCTLEAKLCVVEHHYVCLDHRSEGASFRSQLDAPVNQSAIRLHFFDLTFDESKLFRLGKRELKGYLGYIICRDSGGPIVGRSLLKTPGYVGSRCTEIEEPVNLLGQQLWVRGVPFMQQDERFAVCAHVAAWILAYTAFRRGQIERKLIAEVVAAATFARPMHPVHPPGVFANEVVQVLTDLGLGAFKHDTDFESQTDLPVVSSESLDAETDIITVLEGVLNAYKRAEGQADAPENQRSAALGPDADSGEGIEEWVFASSPNAFAVELLRTLANTNDDELIQVLEADDSAKEIVDLESASVRKYRAMTVRAIDEIFATIVRPYIESGFPIYCDTGDHAIVLCGLTEDEEGPVFYFHDDQFGPYLSSRSIIANSRTHFQRQAFQRDNPYEDRVPDKDLSTIELSKHSYTDDQRGVKAIVVGTPRRLLLTPTSALRWTSRAFESVDNALAKLNGSSDGAELRNIHRVSLLMGIDYKALRRKEAAEKRDRKGADVYASVHLSEWIVLVEGLSGDRKSVLYELVFDGTSSETHPLLQFARFGREVRCVHPQTFPAVETCRIRVSTFEPVKPPSVLRKNVHRVT
ncbi:hypothetical protein B7435_26990 [Mycolicibacterium peregrinum]|uniref:hypothetical protein n=1 Tax=Mycolicibacterium peregrinum TaxID=43304 RepID=UPI0006D804A8|nr:hypothetical protein [Mycolicibacterium peregrinum]MCV7202870.1 hypothetical protein [Mycolicibacterium peregrinum]ORW63190.1 hypothetical protein AWC21_02580 [Mycolicibacterium peregrinum]OWL97032.1 hypothetical protein B7435_26990 [Mycolicibacterium peregrinum]